MSSRIYFMHTENDAPLRVDQYARRILVAVSGLSPQIVTETLYALAVSAQPAWVPTEVHLITTAEGARRARRSLLNPGTDWFSRLIKDYQLPPILFDESHIHQVVDAAGNVMEDIRTPQDNMAAADFITGKIRDLTADKDCALHVSIAGGRKTMGFFLGYAISLYGRVQDQMSHVLVSPPFEYSEDFFYPTRKPRVLALPGGGVDASEAVVTLASIPFVSLRQGLSKDLLEGRASFSDTVADAQAAQQPPRLVIDLRGKKIRAGNQTVAMSAAPISLLAMFARRLLRGQGPLVPPQSFVADEDLGQAFMEEYVVCKGAMGSADRSARALKSGMDGAYFSTQKTRLTNELIEKLGYSASHYLIVEESAGLGNVSSLQLALPAQSVSFGSL
jgi:CRISPR-associated protein (TIGR02584 family)